MEPMSDRSDARVLESVHRAEAIAFGRSLLGEAPGEPEIARYLEAQALLFRAPPSPREERLLAFCREHPRAVPYLDAALGVLGREDRVRQGLLVMAAILETTPRHAPAFLSQEHSPAGLLLRLAGGGLLAALRVALGVPLLFVVGRA